MVKWLVACLLFHGLILGVFTVGPEPDWVEPCEFSINPPLKPSQIHLQQLLYSRQNHWEEDTYYLHRAIKIVDEIGGEQISKRQFEYDPSYQKFVLHQLRLYRDGEWFDRLASSRYEILKQEDRLHKGIFQGNEVLVYFLDDVRVGDVIEYAASFIGTHPANRTRNEEIFYLQGTEHSEKIHHRILSSPDRPLFIKPFCTSQSPQARAISPRLLEWNWVGENIPPYEPESNEPSWYILFERVQLTQYSHWKEVVSECLQLYPCPSGFEKIASPPMRELINQWKQQTSQPEEQATLALRFVQDEVRYLGFEEGIKGYQPSDPNIIFQRRFGDCKDKVVLLQALLHCLQIPSYPVLVNSTRQNLSPESLPGFTSLFNHVVLKLQMKESVYWVDPTYTLQGGSLAENYFPDYGWGLVIAKETENLILLPNRNFDHKPTEICTQIKPISPKIAEVSTSFNFHDLEADELRNSLKNLGLKKFSEKALKRFPRKARPLNPLTICDDRQKNVFTATLHYHLPTKTRSNQNFLPIYSYLLKHSLNKSCKLPRRSPYALKYPLWVKEHISVENPFNLWERDIKHISEKHPSLIYTLNLKKEDKFADFHFELRHLKDHVAVEEAQSYDELINKIESPEPLNISSN